jgi:hypothetical protein
MIVMAHSFQARLAVDGPDAEYPLRRISVNADNATAPRDAAQKTGVGAYARSTRSGSFAIARR